MTALAPVVGCRSLIPPIPTELAERNRLNSVFRNHNAEFFLFHGRMLVLLKSPDNKSQAMIDLQGGTVVSYRTLGKERIYINPLSSWESGAVPRGGDVTIFPNFGNCGGAGTSLHGIARRSTFVTERVTYDDTGTTIRLALHDHMLSPEHSHEVHGRFTLRKFITLDENKLTIGLQYIGKDAVTLGLHPYLLHGVRPLLEGLQNHPYIPLSPGAAPFAGDCVVDRRAILPLVAPLFRNYPCGDGQQGPLMLNLSAGVTPTAEIALHGVTNVFLWKAGPNQQLSDFPLEDRNETICIEPVRRVAASLEIKSPELRAVFTFK